MRHPEWTAAIAALFLAGSLTSCGAASTSTSTMETAAVTDYAASADMAEGTTSLDAGIRNAADAVSYEEEDGSESAAIPADSSRKLVVTVDYEVETKDFDGLDQVIREKTDALGGYISYSSIQGDAQEGGRTASYTVLVPAEHLTEFTSSLEGEANILSKSTSTEDITLEYNDTDSRREALEEEEKQLLALMDKAETVDEMIQIENALSDVRAKRKDLETQINLYDNETEYSTVSLYVTETKVYTEPEEETSWQERISEGFGESLEELRTHAENLAVRIVSNLPMILYYIVLIFIVILLVRLFVWILVRIFASSEWKAKKKERKLAKKQAKAEKKQAAKKEKELEKEEERKLLADEKKKE